MTRTEIAVVIVCALLVAGIKLCEYLDKGKDDD